MKTLLTLIFCTLLIHAEASAAPKKKSAKAKTAKTTTPVRVEMNTISGHIRDLGPYIASENEFVKDANKSIIQKHLEDLTNLFKNLKVHPVIDTQGLSLNQGVIAEQLEQTLALFKKDKKAHARAKFNAALNICVSCHTQSPGTVQKEQPKFFADKDISKLKINDYERAELYFITRDFEGAMKLYDKFLRASKKTDDDEFIFKALE
ncbi:MAG: hypothetical protein ACXVCE_17160, partial [Bacteriovorax sp.]